MGCTPCFEWHKRLTCGRKSLKGYERLGHQPEVFPAEVWHSSYKLRQSIKNFTTASWSILKLLPLGKINWIRRMQSIEFLTTIVHHVTKLSSLVSFSQQNDKVLIPHSPYSTGLVPADFHLFTKIKMQLDVCHLITSCRSRANRRKSSTC